VPETAVKFVDGVGSDIKTVYAEVGAGDAILTGIADMFNILGLLLALG